MSYADKVFRDTVKDIIENGTDTRNEKVRPHWLDGTLAYTIKKFGVANTYDLRKEFPACTFRKTALKSCMDEILWIYQKKSNNIHDLKPHIWDEWADESGSIGKAYGYQVGKKDQIRVWTSEPAAKLPFVYPVEEEYHTERAASLVKSDRKGIETLYTTTLKLWIDQMDAVLYDLKHTPFSRRIKINLYNVHELNEMHLYPCCYDLTFNVTVEAGYDKPILNLHLNQRSQDMLAANNWNVCQYSILLMMVARSVNMIPGKLFHTITDCHIYDRHVAPILDMIEREEFPAPKVYLNPEITNFYDFTTKDLIVEGYQYGEQIEIPIAI